MAFWGIEVIPDKPYIYFHSGEQGRLHISQAILGDGSSKEKSMVECHVGAKDPVYICSLFPDKSETSSLNLEFDEHNVVMFKVIGSRSIHLSGFFTGESKYSFLCESEDDTDELSDFDTEDNAIDEDPDTCLSSPGSDMEGKDIADDNKCANEIGKPKQSKKKKQLSASDGNGNSQRKNTVKSGTSVPVLESEDEDGFPITSPQKRKTDVLNTDGNEGEIKDKEISEACKSNKAADDPSHLKSLKRKVDAVVQAVEDPRKTGKLLDSSLAVTEAVADDDAKEKKKGIKKKPRGKGESTNEAGIGSTNPMQTEEATTTDRDWAAPVGTEHDEKSIAEKNIIVDADLTADENQSKKKKKKKGKSKKQENIVNADMEKTVTDRRESNMEIEEKTDAKPFQVRSFPNGLVIEELAMGKPDGKKASPGKKVSVHYIGKLKKNGKIFDANVGRAPFKFRLGVGQVIKGWDVGVNGMRVGDKRRLTIPPAMGYGAQGAGGAIPPNSWLVFDVELVNVS